MSGALVRSACCALAVGTCTPASATDGDLDALVDARFIHCAFFRSSALAETPLGGEDERKAELLVHYAGIDPARTRARAITTRSAGAKDVVVVRTRKAVHFVESVAGAYRVTTVTGCNERDTRPGRRQCVTYGAANAMHFDASVLWQPDAVYERIRHIANHGFCDHSFQGAPR
jgi:hypothetical protein